MKQFMVMIQLLLLSTTLTFARTTDNGNTREPAGMKTWPETTEHHNGHNQAVNQNTITAPDKVQVTASKGTTLDRVALFNHSGTLVKEYPCRNKEVFSFYVSSMPEGLYFLKSYTSTGSFFTHRISIEH